MVSLQKKYLVSSDMILHISCVFLDWLFLCNFSLGRTIWNCSNVKIKSASKSRYLSNRRYVIFFFERKNPFSWKKSMKFGKLPPKICFWNRKMNIFFQFFQELENKNWKMKKYWQNLHRNVEAFHFAGFIFILGITFRWNLLNGSYPTFQNIS